MFLMNKTASWIQNCDFDLTSVVSYARKSVNSERGLFQRRKRKIQRQRKQKQQEEFQKKAKVKRRLNRLEKQSDEIAIYGLWKTKRACKQKLRNKGLHQKKTKALKAQLRYRKNVLKQTCTEKGLFALTKRNTNGKRLSMSFKELLSILQKVLKSV